MAVARIERLSFSYPDAERPALADVSLSVVRGQVVLALGRSGSGKSTLLRALAGLVPHFHGGRFCGRVEVGGLDTRYRGPAALAGTVATLFQDPEDQVVFTRVLNEVAFGLENVGTPREEIEGRARSALAAVGAEHLAERLVVELSGGELQRVCLASTLALDPELLLLDEPTSQLDPEGAGRFLDLVRELASERGIAVVLAEQRPERPLAISDRVLFLDAGRLVLDAPVDRAREWLETRHPSFLSHEGQAPGSGEVPVPEIVCNLSGVSFAYHDHLLVVDQVDLDLRRGEIVVLEGPNGSGKTTLAKLAAGLLEPTAGRVERRGRATYLAQDPGRYVVRERVDEEAAVGVDGDLSRARRALAAVGLTGLEDRHPRDLSSGERERLALASVLAPEPDLLVLDEPTRGVDPERKRELARLLRADAAARATLVVTHDRTFAASVADRVVSLAPDRQPVHA